MHSFSALALRFMAVLLLISVALVASAPPSDPCLAQCQQNAVQCHIIATESTRQDSANAIPAEAAALAKFKCRDELRACSSLCREQRFVAKRAKATESDEL